MTRKRINQEKTLIIILFSIFILTEIIDDLLDHVLGNSIIHSIAQLFIFILLFFIMVKIFLRYHKKKIKKLLPEELLIILQIIKEAEHKKTTINLRVIRTKLNITKPTLNKRINQLIELEYLTTEKKGNKKYLTITTLGSSFIK